MCANLWVSVKCFNSPLWATSVLVLATGDVADVNDVHADTDAAAATVGDDGVKGTEGFAFGEGPADDENRAEEKDPGLDTAVCKTGLAAGIWASSCSS
mmetsp:Transcript_81/g.144  ORF Transcript_81/g.144 Transcript_81/m.144 type:complete len:98 (+) Transcript_81:1626-1919(+)